MATTETCGAGLSLGEAGSSTPCEEISGITWTLLRLAAVCPEAAAVHWGRPHSRTVYLSPYKYGFASCTQDLWDAQVASTGDWTILYHQDTEPVCFRVRITTLALGQIPYSVHNFLILKKYTGILDSSVLILWLKIMRHELHGFCILMMLMQTVIILDADWCTCI